MRRMVVAFLDGARKGSCMAVCDGDSPSKTEFQVEARRMMVADGLITVDEGGQVQFIVQD